MQLTTGAMTPEIFRKWSAISLVAGALERRVWVKATKYITFPNLYVMLVAAPAIGKQTIEDARHLMAETTEPGTRLSAFKVAPDSMTRASLVDNIAKAKQIKIQPKGPPLIYHSLYVTQEEGSVLIPSYDMEFIGVLNSLYQNKTLHEESRRTGSVRELKIEYPQLNLLLGAQPSYLATTFPDEAWNSGFARRLLMIYASETPFVDLFSDHEVDMDLRARVLQRLSFMSTLYGAMEWSPEAMNHIVLLNRAHFAPVPDHSKLVHYVRARTQHILKLTLVSAVSRTGRLRIERVDVDRAVAWLHEAERFMPDIFREMVGRSDKQVIEELHLYAIQMYNRNKRQSLDGNIIWTFLSERVPSEKIEKIIMVAENSGVLIRVADIQGRNLFRPAPRHAPMGVE